MQKDFSYPLLVADLPNVENSYKLEADKENLEYIKDLLEVEKVNSFSAEVHVKYNYKTGKIKVWGKVDSQLELMSVVSLEKFAKKYHPEFEITFDTKADYQEFDGKEFGLDDEVFDEVIGGKIDIAEIAIEQLALVIEDYPRKDGEGFSFESEFTEEEKPNPFAVLSNLKK